MSIQVTAHAISRFRERAPAFSYPKNKKGVRYNVLDETIRKKILQLLEQSKPVELKGTYRVVELLDHKLQKATHHKVRFMGREWIIKVCNHRVLTFQPYNKKQYEGP